MALFTRMRIQPRHQNARCGDAEFSTQIVLQNRQHLLQQSRIQGIGHRTQGQVGGGQGHAQTASGQHHYHLLGVAFGGQVFGVAAKRHSGIVDNALVYRRGNHGGKFTGRHACISRIKQIQHIRRIGRRQLPRHHRRCHRQMVNIQYPGLWRGIGLIIAQVHVFAQQLRSCLQHGFIAQHHHAVRPVSTGQIQAHIRANARRLTAGDRQPR